MPIIHTDLQKPALAASIQSNLHAFLRQIPRSESPGETGLIRWQTGLAHPWFNGVLVERDPLPQDQHLIKEIKHDFNAGGVRAWSWWAGEPTSPLKWAGLLAEAGFHYEHATPGMAIRLDDVTNAAGQVPGLEIQEVRDLPSLQLWSRIFVQGYGLPDSWTEALYQLMEGIGLDLPIRHYLGYLDGEPVATASLFLGAGVAGIYNVATLPQSRRKGIGAALTVVPLLDARQLGYQFGILQSSEAGFKVYERLGFEKLCEVELFVWVG